MEASGRHLEEAQEALERGDLVDMTISFMRVEVELSERLPDWSEEFCRAEDILATTQEISAAAEQGDADRLPSRYQESQEPGTMLKQELSAEAQPIVEMFHFFAP